MMDATLIVYGLLLVIGMWYAFRSGQLYERERQAQRNKHTG
jgi:hypothetical protein